MLTTSELSQELELDEGTVRSWVQLSKNSQPISRRVGGRRVFDPDDAFAIRLAAALYRLGVRISPEILNEIIAVAFSGQRSGTVAIRRKGAASININLAEIQNREQ